ncbi:hypothetical protein [Streptomyces sp. NPDC054849]
MPERAQINRYRIGAEGDGSSDIAVAGAWYFTDTADAFRRRLRYIKAGEPAICRRLSPAVAHEAAAHGSGCAIHGNDRTSLAIGNVPGGASHSRTAVARRLRRLRVQGHLVLVSRVRPRVADFES